MALGATVRRFDLEVSDVDRGVYESLDLKVAQHPSENGPYLVARMLAYALELEEGLAFTNGLAASDEPALWVRDLTGRLAMDLPDEFSRVSDFLNFPQDFFAVERGEDGPVLVAKDHVIGIVPHEKPPAMPDGSDVSVEENA